MRRAQLGFSTFTPVKYFPLFFSFLILWSWYYITYLVAKTHLYYHKFSYLIVIVIVLSWHYSYENNFRQVWYIFGTTFCYRIGSWFFIVVQKALKYFTSSFLILFLSFFTTYFWHELCPTFCLPANFQQRLTRNKFWIFHEEF